MPFSEPPFHGEIDAVIEHMFDCIDNEDYLALESSLVGLKEWLRAHTKASHSGQEPPGHPTAPDAGLGSPAP